MLDGRGDGRAPELARRCVRGSAAALVLLWLAAGQPLRAEDAFPDLPALPDTAAALEADIVRLVGTAPPTAEPPPVADEPAITGAIAARAEPETPEPPAAPAILPPDLPAVTVIVEVKPQAASTGPAPPITPDIPAPPAIVASVEVPAEAPAAAMPAGTETREAPAPPALVVEEARIRAFLEARRARLRLSEASIESFIATYGQRGQAPIWLAADGSLSAKSGALAGLIAGADRDGLDPARLQAVLPAMPPGPLPEGERFDAELGLSLAAWLYARDARGGRLEPSRLSAMLTPVLTLPAPAEVLGKAAGEEGEALAAALAAYNPRHAGYRALRTELARLRAAAQAEAEQGGSPADQRARALAALKPGFLDGGQLVPGREDARAPALRLRLGLAENDSLIIDSELIGALKEFQRANELQPNGRLTPRTRAALENFAAPLTRNAAPDRAALIAMVIANMERWRWLPPDLGTTHIFVNVPDFRLDLVSDGQLVHQTRVIVGKPETQTPVFSDEMEFLVVNPSWTVPLTILKKEFLPRLAVDPDYAERKGYEVIRRGNQITVRQPPGEANALGQIKFMFPNSHAVYLHDTPTRHLFANETRAYSHGCIRVDKPFQLAELLLQKRQGLGERQLRGMVGYGERTIRLVEKVPVHLAYFTLFVDEAGQLQRRADLYGHDARLRRALAL